MYYNTTRAVLNSMLMFDKKGDITVGKITKLYGTNGELTLRLYDEFPEEPDFTEPFYATINGIVTPLFISSFTPQGKLRAIIIFSDFTNEYRSRELVGLELSVSSDTYAQEDVDEEDMTLADLVGYALNDKTSNKTGVILEFIDNPNNPLFEVEIDGIELFVPAVEEIIDFIDVRGECVDMRLPEGLISLYSSPEEYDY